MNIIEARQVTKTYTVGHREIRVLEDVSLSVSESEFLVVEGSSGSGKTTLLSLLSGLDKPTSGRVFLQEKDITDKSEDDLAQLRKDMIGFVFQSFHLIPSLTALENIMFPAELKRDPAAREKAKKLLQRMGVDERSGNFPHQLSGGEMQRVAMCRALINNPKIIFADEPTGNLDSENGRAILELLLEFQRESRTTLVLVTHSIYIAKMADRMIVLQDGRIASEHK
jgi:putative ABC transport system ATP-binding protein